MAGTTAPLWATITGLDDPGGGLCVPMYALAYVAVAIAAAGSLRGCPEAVTRRSDPERPGPAPDGLPSDPPPSLADAGLAVRGVIALMVRITLAGGGVYRAWVRAATSETLRPGPLVPLFGDADRARDTGAAPPDDMPPPPMGWAADGAGDRPREIRLDDREMVARPCSWLPLAAATAAGDAGREARRPSTCSTWLSLM